MQQKLILKAGVCSDVGRTRSKNEDNFYLQEKVLPVEKTKKNYSFGFELKSKTVCGVFDGMGGESDGDLASFYAASYLDNYVDEMLSNPSSGISDYINSVNAKICDLISKNSASMGSTLAIATISNNNLTMYNIGDSRGYIFRNGKIKLLTKDHTVVEYLISNGMISKEEAKTDPRRHQLTQHLGIHPDEMLIEAYASECINIQGGDVILLCSDGVTDGLSDLQISEILSENIDPKTMAKSVVDAAITKGSRDNTTALVMKICMNEHKRIEIKQTFLKYFHKHRSR